MTELVQPIKRVEQYLYALCVLDFSNIPVPRSRLEIFTHAMITGELPEIAPETREEEYMVAIIKGDVSNLPTPKSRADHLLYRICLGETEIRDIELETRYEMLLAYLAEHGGTDLEYALINYTAAFETLYNTVEMPVKSAILKGNTLINLYKADTTKTTSDGSFYFVNAIPSSMFKSNTYTVINTTNKKISIAIRSMSSNAYIRNIEIDALTKIAVTLSNDEWIRFFIAFTSNGWVNGDANDESMLKKMVVIEGDYTNVNIPYFEGMQSVKMPVLTTTGKNLFDFNDLELGSLNNIGEPTTSSTVRRNKNFINVSHIDKFTLSMPGYVKSDGWRYVSIYCYDGNKKYLGSIPLGDNLNVYQNRTLLDNTKLIKICIGQPVENISDVFDVQLEKGTVATSYEPYKSNILTVNEEVVLRGIGEVQDTLNCLTGEVVQNIGEIVLDGSENWRADGGNELYSRFIYSISDVRTKWYKVLSDKFIGAEINSLDGEKIYRNGYGRVNGIVISNNKLENLTVDGLKAYLMTNPVTVQYELEESIVKTVVLTTTDQDNQPTQLKTFNDVTYVETQADSVLPTVILEYGTKNQEALAALSQDHEEVADAQAALSDAIDSQSDEVETTMMALTEVYEGRNEE